MGQQEVGKASLKSLGELSSGLRGNRDKARAYLTQKARMHRTGQVTLRSVSLESSPSSVRTGNGCLTCKHVQVTEAGGPVTCDGWELVQDDQEEDRTSSPSL